ncbi:hypothetical protein [Ktedonobacter racemifer]|uniref:Uncharacterized protein n=1 Tax=Ktedonobacter racemifer DSM 44963 TaxID=485913 RepID=D6TGF5_KTERA|nr:hypothetical protein [Ktedonobacter racemifer]EFH90667.1 hypothetical protein Krac_12294 [Ktedonobacter racemifer DSM 44963]
MDGQKAKLEGDNRHIWLRYATEFESGGRRHTLEMGIPMPLGASDQEREQLLNEAEQGLDQLISRIEKRVSRAIPSSVSGNAPGSLRVSTPAPQGAPAGGRPATPPQRPASVPAPQTSTQPTQPTSKVRESAAPVEEAQAPVPRQHSGVTLPSVPKVTGDLGGDMSLPDFIHYIKETWGIEPHEAMKQLNVRSLSNINRRSAIARLRELRDADSGGDDKQHLANQSTQTTASTTGNERPHQASSAEAQNEQRSQPRQAEAQPVPQRQTEAAKREAVADQPTRPVIAAPQVNGNNHTTLPTNVVPLNGTRQAASRQARAFDEEVEPEDLDGLVDLEEGEEPMFSQAILDVASDKLHTFREMQGATTASPDRLKVLNILVGSQISKEQLHALLAGVWGITIQKKLKVDQNEALISWAKEDNFIPEVEAVLHLLEEEKYARGNR